MVMTWLAEDILLVIGSLSMECSCETLSLCVFGANYIKVNVMFAKLKFLLRPSAARELCLRPLCATVNDSVPFILIPKRAGHSQDHHRDHHRHHQCICPAALESGSKRQLSAINILKKG